MSLDDLHEPQVCEVRAQGFRFSDVQLGALEQSTAFKNPPNTEIVLMILSGVPALANSDWDSNVAAAEEELEGDTFTFCVVEVLASRASKIRTRQPKPNALIALPRGREVVTKETCERD